LVYADWLGLEGSVLMGELGAQQVRGKEVFSFSYSGEWLDHSACRLLDPELRLYPGRQYVPEGRPNFGVFLDSSPDRWGRTLMKRREALLARNEQRAEQMLFESDYLLGVYDHYRSGGIRFKTDEDGAFQNHYNEYPAPPQATLSELSHACRLIEQDDFPNLDQDSLKWFALLLAPGSSLGGARPKAGLKDERGGYWIAKFPSIHDERDVGAWEMVLNKMAAMADITVPKSRLIRLTGQYQTYLSSRFDRTHTGKRIHFASAMTLLGYLDGAGAQEGVSYLEMVEFIKRHSPNTGEALEELWRRIVFNILVSNTDDHLRNHGFLLSDDGWRLAPAYDMNPNPYRGGLSLNISETDNRQDTSLALMVAPYFTLNHQKAQEILTKVSAVVRRWSQLAKEHHIPRHEIDRMSSAFIG
jgi:serine/threonine-protein kinase HipA